MNEPQSRPARTPRTDAAHALADWGTTHLRVWLVTAAGDVLAVDESANGMGVLQPDQFAGVLEQALARMDAPPHMPVMICGMAGARQGWRECPYADCPVALDGLATRAIGFMAGSRAIRIMPGVARRTADRPDVMRGEETQLLGLSMATGMADAIACLPGTHSKWVRIEQGRIADFATAMTGELYALLSRHSILRHAVGTAASVSATDPAFLSHVDHALEGDGLARLFSVRAASLLNGADEAASAAALSGLLIGAELRGLSGLMGAQHGKAGTVHIIASGSLAALYAAALGQAGFAATIHKGEDLVRAGLHAAAHVHFGSDARAAQ